jgi:microcystin degradation protein MlrC
LASEIGHEFVAMRGRTARTIWLRCRHQCGAGVQWQSVVMADPADNAGGGAPNDNTMIYGVMARDGQRDTRPDLGIRSP